MEQYIVNESNPSGSWLYSRGSGTGYTSFLRCPFCGAIREWDESEETMPESCGECNQAVSGNRPNV